MNDPWDVKSVRQSNQYVSCMKINGVPLLPPVLSKECRQEMEYYKLLAKEVEKRISILKPYVGSVFDPTDDVTDAPELPECEQDYETPPKNAEDDYNVTTDKVTKVNTSSSLELSNVNLDSHQPHVTNEKYKSITSNVTVKTTEASSMESSKFVIDLSLCINESGRNVVESVKPHHVSETLDLPERDYEYPKKPQKEITDFESNDKEIEDFDLIDRNNCESYASIPFNNDGPSSLSSKSFTGSLYDIHTDSMKESQLSPKLIRQSSYTVLKPSPQLLAHLKVQSLNTGVEMETISMSESFSNLDIPNNKKRRSWDLESAKVKWSSMALELKGATGYSKTNSNTNHAARSVTKKGPQTSSPIRSRSVAPDKTRRASLTTNTIPKSEPIKTKNVTVPVKPLVASKQLIPTSKKDPASNSNQKIENEPVSPTHRSKDTPKPMNQSKELASPKSIALISSSDDPAFRVRELYEKIQNQQLMQMANLVEKQKREQLLLQQVFEEQNTILFKQLKNICPKSPIEVKMAWGDKTEDEGRGPVSLSQVINHKSPEKTPVANTLTKTINYISQCDSVLKKSRDITSNIKQQPKTRSSRQEVNKARTSSPTNRNSSRKLNYDSSSDREYEPILTDRTNDTLADLNVTFPSDSDDYQNYGNNTSHMIHKEMSKKQCVVLPSGTKCRSTDSAIRCLEDSIQHSINSMSISHTVKPGSCLYQPTVKEREAATKIVAHAKGWLVRRLMKTERVQATVQTIRDALLCALQLHQDREGIRGADVDLHRRLIQQITAACYTLHDTFVASSAADRCAMIAADRGRRRSVASRQATPRSNRYSDVMSQSHSGSFPTRNMRATSASLMTQSNYETFNGDKSPASRARYMPSPRRRPWR